MLFMLALTGLLAVVASSGSFLELLRQVCLGLGAPPVTNSVTRLLAVIRDSLCDITATILASFGIPIPEE